MNNPTNDIPRAQLFELLKNRGWIGPIDWFMLGMVISWPLISHFIFGLGIICTLLVHIFIMLWWILFVVYRIAYFIIIVQVSMDSMPATSAKLAVKFLKTVPSNLPSGA